MDLWEDFSIIFKDLLTNKIFRLEKSVLYEEIEENVQLCKKMISIIILR